MKALSIRHPWLEATILGKKRVESRSKATHYRGELALHSTKARERHVDAWIEQMYGGRPLRAVVDDIESRDLVYGAVLAVAELVDCHAADGCHGCSHWATRTGYHWQFAAIRPLAEPIPADGALGFWDLPPTAEIAVRAQLAMTPDHHPSEGIRP